jgi:CRP/FNR family transcriptional regulator, cyclic AMP receptor protein
MATECGSDPGTMDGPGCGVRLLLVDPELGEGLTAEQLAQVGQRVVLPTVELARGPVAIRELGEADGVRGEVHGFLLLAGALTINLQMSGRRCTRLIGIRELVLLDGLETDSIPVSWDWSALTPARLALFDDRLLLIARRWPALMSAILKRAAQQTRQAFLQQAISQLPRVEERLLALFWSIADRQGVVRADGVWVELSATHETLAQMIGAQRPTVSLGLARLTEAGFVCPGSGGWLIKPASREEFPLGRPRAGEDPPQAVGV